MSNKALIAVGGNSLIRAGERGTLEEQSINARATAQSIATMINSSWDMVVAIQEILCCTPIHSPAC